MLGVTWSPAAADVLPLVDFVEVAGWARQEPPDSVPRLLHNLDLDFSLTRPGAIDQEWISSANQAIRETGTPWLSLHIGMSAEEVRFDGHMLPVSDPLDPETCFQRIRESLTLARNGVDAPLLIENLDYCPEGAYEHICQPWFIRDLVLEVDCGFLLDLAHAQVSADWLGYSIDEYLENLPLERVREIHLSSPRRGGERLDDVHAELRERDYALFATVLQWTSVEAVVIEYRRDGAALAEQIGRIRNLLPW